MGLGLAHMDGSAFASAAKSAIARLAVSWLRERRPRTRTGDGSVLQRGEVGDLIDINDDEKSPRRLREMLTAWQPGLGGRVGAISFVRESAK